MKRLGWLLILLVVAVGLLLPFSITTQSPDNVLAYGMKVVLDNNVETIYQGQTVDGNWEGSICHSFHCQG